MKAAKILFFVFSLSICGTYSALSNENRNKSKIIKQFEQAENLIKHGNYNDALTIYNELFALDANNFNWCYKIGLCYLKIKDQKASYYLEKASVFTTQNYSEGSFKERKAPLLTYKLLAEAYHLSSKFDLAIDTYNNFKKLMLKARNHDYELIKETNREIEMCKNAKALVASPINVKIENMGLNVNSAYPDYSPVFTADQMTMIFTSGRPGNVGEQTYDGGKYFEDIYTSTKQSYGWSAAINIGPPINTVGNEASVGISADGQEILIYKDDMGDGNIYSTSLKGNDWTVPVKLNANINSKHWEPSAFISANGNTLYFTSDRPGGYGGRDIYKSNKDKNGEWGRAINLGNKINSGYDEDAPFLHSNGVTLYFSSNGHETMGGFDIFESEMLSNGSWTEPTNVGYPINSPGDDVFYVVSPDKKIAYFTSMRKGGYGEKDNYVITFPDIKENALLLQKGLVLGNQEEVIGEVKITITDNETEEVLGVYHPNTATGKYVFILTPGKSHNISYEKEGFLFYSENRYVADEANYKEITNSVKLVPILEGSKIVLNNIFFDFDKIELRPYSSVELNKLNDFLIKHPELSVSIAGYTDSKGDDEYNNTLSIARAYAVIHYLTAKGIKKERLVAVGHGEWGPIAPNKNADGTDSPDGRQLNRRVELMITGIK